MAGVRVAGSDSSQFDSRLVLGCGLQPVRELLMERPDEIWCVAQILGGDPGGFLVSALTASPSN